MSNVWGTPAAPNPMRLQVVLQGAWVVRWLVIVGSVVAGGAGAVLRERQAGLVPS
jgi:hypothetical protein